MIDGKVEVWQLVLGGKVGGLPGVVEEGLLVDVGRGEELGRVRLVLDEDALLQQTLLFGSHDEVMGLVLKSEGKRNTITRSRN